MNALYINSILFLIVFFVCNKLLYLFFISFCLSITYAFISALVAGLLLTSCSTTFFSAFKFSMCYFAVSFFLLSLFSISFFSISFFLVFCLIYELNLSIDFITPFLKSFICFIAITLEVFTSRPYINPSIDSDTK